MRSEIIVTQHSERFACCACVILILLDIAGSRVPYVDKREVESCVCYCDMEMEKPNLNHFSTFSIRFNFDKLIESYTHELIALWFSLLRFEPVVVLD